MHVVQPVISMTKQREHGTVEKENHNLTVRFLNLVDQNILRNGVFKMRKNLNDLDVLKKLQKMRKAGRAFVRAGEIARIFSVDSVRALGAMLRVEKLLHKTR